MQSAHLIFMSLRQAAFKPLSYEISSFLFSCVSSREFDATGHHVVVIMPHMLNAMFASIDAQYGSFPLFLESQLGVGPQELKIMRRVLLT